MHLVKALHEAGFDVKGIDNYTDPESRLRAKELAPLVSVEDVSVLDMEGMHRAFKGSSHIFHLAAETHVDTSLINPIETVRVNALGTAQVLEVARKLDASLTYVSTDEVFGDLPLEGNEKFSAYSAIKPSSPYSSSKAAGELLVLSWAKSFDLEVTITNCGNNYGEFQSVRKFIPRTMALLAAEKRAVLYGNGQNVRDWIHASDHASALISVMLNGKSGNRYCIGVENPVTNQQLMSHIVNAANKSLDWVDSVSDRPGHDLRYEIDPSAELKEWGWNAQQNDVLKYIGVLWRHYKIRLEKGELSISNVSHRGLSG